MGFWKRRQEENRIFLDLDEDRYLKDWAAIFASARHRGLTVIMQQDQYNALKKVLQKLNTTVDKWFPGVPVKVELDWPFLNEPSEPKEQTENWGLSEVSKGSVPKGLSTSFGASIAAIEKENEKMDLTNEIGLETDKEDEKRKMEAKMKLKEEEINIANKEAEEKSNPEKPIHVLIRVHGIDPVFCNRLYIESPPGRRFIPNVWLCDRRKDHLGDCTTVRVESSVQHVHKER